MMAIRVRVSDPDAAADALKEEYEGTEGVLENVTTQDAEPSDVDDAAVTQEDEMPGFGPLAGLAGLGGGAYLLLRRRER